MNPKVCYNGIRIQKESIIMKRSEILEIQYDIFNRMRDHWQDFEKESLPVVLDMILNEIYHEQLEAFDKENL